MMRILLPNILTESKKGRCVKAEKGHFLVRI